MITAKQGEKQGFMKTKMHSSMVNICERI